MKTANQFWQPDIQTRAAIRRGDKLHREYVDRKKVEYELAMIERLARVEQQAGSRP